MRIFIGKYHAPTSALALSVALVATAGSVTSVRAEVKLPAIFADHMVLQRELKVPVWGTADDGEKVSVEFAGQKVETVAKDGKWSAVLEPLQASSVGGKLIVAGTNKVEFNDVVVGEVWLCSGQSNMEFPVSGDNDSRKMIAETDNPRIRHFKIRHATAEAPQADIQTMGGWQTASPATVGRFTAVGYFFAREVEKQLDVPIGLIGCNWGGTRIEPWNSPAGPQAKSVLKAGLVDPTSTSQPEKPVRGANGKPKIKVRTNSPAAIYNAMVHPIATYAIRGTLWYQGESNNGDGMMYLEKMKALIAGWRAIWQEGDFPFYFVQLAPYHYGKPEALPGIWEAQTAALSIPHTGMAVITDVATVDNIHPPDKQTVGHRLALWALAKTYHKPVAAFASPLFDSFNVQGDKAYVVFKNGEGGLKSTNGQPLTWFTIAGEDRKFVEAKAEIDGSRVVVSAPGVDQPVAVRFGWNELAEPNLANAAGLPASPFRTDRWTDAIMPVIPFVAETAEK